MRCSDWEERIALWVGGDLGDSAAEIERHLTECEACRAFAAEMRESLGMLRGVHAEEIPAAAFTAIRAKVLDRLARRWWKRAWVYAAAAIVLLAAGIGLRRPAKQVARVSPPALVTNHDVEWPVSAEALPVNRGLPAAKHKRSLTVASRKAVPRRAHKQAQETILVKIETGNPDVVIYWIAETKGEE